MSFIPKFTDAERVQCKASIMIEGLTGKGKSGLTKGGILTFDGEEEFDITKPSTSNAKLWDGYGTGLKPAYEPIIMAMKPTEGTFAENALKYGVAGLNIDMCRIGNENGSHKSRFPANLIHDGSDIVDEFFPEITSII